jgi:hypothetical protein
MAKLPASYSFHANRIEALLSEGRRPQAIAYAAKQLRLGQANLAFLAAVADLLEPKANAVGRPRKAAPADWFDIGMAFEGLFSSGQTYEYAINALAERFHRGHRTVERAVKYYREAKAEADAEDPYRQ